MLYNGVLHVTLNDTSVVLICTNADCGIRVHADFRIASPERMCGVVLASRDPTLVNLLLVCIACYNVALIALVL